MDRLKRACRFGLSLGFIAAAVIFVPSVVYVLVVHQTISTATTLALLRTAGLAWLFVGTGLALLALLLNLRAR